MPERKITFGGDEIPAHIASTPQIIRAKRKMTTTPIPGTNREVVNMEDAWECYDQPYTLYVGDGSADSVQTAINNVAQKLYKKGWQTLVDDNEPDYFRYAYYQGPFDVENRDTRLGKFKVSFKCRPERFLVSGNTAVSVATGGTISNPTAFDAKPLIHIVGSGSGTLTIGTATLSFTGIVDYLNVDCEKEDCYRLPAENRNNLMTGTCPVLKSGSNTVTFTGGITAVSITPRWWII